MKNSDFQFHFLQMVFNFKQTETKLNDHDPIWSRSSNIFCLASVNYNIKLCAKRVQKMHPFN